MALTKHGIRANGLSFFRDQTVEREERKIEKKRKRKKRRREEEEKPRSSKKVWNYDLYYGSMGF